MREHKIVRLSWIIGDFAYAIMYRSPGAGWSYLLKYLSKDDAEKLLEGVKQ